MKPSPWYSIKAQADSSEPVEVLLYGDISSYYGDVNAKGFIEALKPFEGRRLKLRINSPGGDVWQGHAIHNYLKTRGNIEARVDGIAASMASVIAMAAEKIIMPANSMMMIHRVSGCMCGDAGDFEEYKDLLEKLDSQIAGIYAARTGKTEEECLELMDASTWMTGKEAVAEGFADEETEEVVVTAKLQEFTNILSRHGKLPAALSGGQPPTPRTTQQPTTENNMEKLLKLLAALKLIPSAKVNEDEAVDFLKEAHANLLDTHAQQLKAANDERDILKGKLEAADKLKATAAVEAAVKAGKIKDEPALRARWEKALLDDPTNAQAMLDGMTGTGTAPRGRTTGAPPVPEAAGDGLAGEPQTLDEVRAAMAKETDPDKKWALAQKARELRGHKELFKA